MLVAKAHTCRSCPSWQASPPAGSQPKQNAQRYQHRGSWCRTLVAPCSLSILPVSTYSLYCERLPKARPLSYNADQDASPPPEVNFQLREDARMGRQVQFNLVIRACSPWTHTKQYVMSGSFSMDVGKTFGATVTGIYYPCYPCVMVASYRLLQPTLYFGH